MNLTPSKRIMGFLPPKQIRKADAATYIGKENEKNTVPQNVPK